MATKGKTIIKFNKTPQEKNYLLSEKKTNTHHSEAVTTVQICDSGKKSHEATET